MQIDYQSPSRYPETLHRLQMILPSPLYQPPLCNNLHPSDRVFHLRYKCIVTTPCSKIADYLRRTLEPPYNDVDCSSVRYSLLTIGI